MTGSHFFILQFFSSFFSTFPKLPWLRVTPVENHCYRVSVLTVLLSNQHKKCSSHLTENTLSLLQRPIDYFLLRK
jgi:hypothetical protein